MSIRSAPATRRSPTARLLAGLVALSAAVTVAAPLAAVAGAAPSFAGTDRHAGTAATVTADQHSTAARVDLPLLAAPAPVSAQTAYGHPRTADSSHSRALITAIRVHTRGPPADGRIPRPSVHL